VVQAIHRLGVASQPGVQSPFDDVDLGLELAERLI
jgi:hypothetical protein